MKNIRYKAFIVEEIKKDVFKGEVRETTVNDLPEGDVIVKVKYSALNYKDALSATGNRGVTRNYPHTPGIDAAGTIHWSGKKGLEKGDDVIVTGYDFGMNTSGGFGQYIRVPSDWVIKCPPGLTLKQSMIMGTAGVTAGMSVSKLSRTVKPEHGKILVTGATGGVGSLAVGILSKLGYHVTALSGKKNAKSFLESLGAKEIITREALLEHSKRPMLKAQWAGAVDTVGGEILASAVKSIQDLGVVTCCGNVASADLPLTVFPFILRGVTLIGIDSQNCPMEERKEVWENLSHAWKLDLLDEYHKEISLDELNDAIQKILKGQNKGRVLVDLDL
jgi:acrylyl-CoA reductase (NADPH)